VPGIKKGVDNENKQIAHIWKWGLLISIFSFWAAPPPRLYSVNMYYDADKAAIPAYLKADKASNAIISIAEFTDTRHMDDRLVIGHVVERDGMKNLVLPKNVK